MLLTTQMVAPKVVGGIARCISKTDVSGLCTRAKIPLLTRLEGELGEVERFCNSLLASMPRNAAAEVAISNMEGLFKVRLGAHVCKKGQMMERTLPVFLKGHRDNKMSRK